MVAIREGFELNHEGFEEVPGVGYVALRPLSYERVLKFPTACNFLKSKGYKPENRTGPVIMESKADLETLVELCGSRMLTAQEAPSVLRFAKTRTYAQELHRDMTSNKENEGLFGEAIKSGNEYLAVACGDWANLYELDPDGEAHVSPAADLLNCLGAREVRSY